jgi:glutathione synthase/RimK-type ligase-like ATP-grasp enzyme
MAVAQVAEGTGRLSVLFVLGLKDDNRLELTFLSPDAERCEYSYAGNVDLLSFLDEDEFEVARIVCGEVPSEDAPVPEIHVMVNAVCDPDLNGLALNRVADIQQQLGVPIVNRPDRVAGTSRDHVALRLASLAGVTVPKTVRVRPTGHAAVVPMAAELGVRPPFLVRELGAHGGRGLVLVKQGDDLSELETFRYDGRDLYVTEFFDFVSPDGLYRKRRVIVVDGVPFPRHMIASHGWNVHTRDREKLMHERPELQAEEREFLAHVTHERFPAFAAMASLLELDYFGVDFALDDRDGIVLFECNCCFRSSRLEEGPGGVPAAYHEASIARIKKALGDLIRARAAESVGAPG